MIRIRRITLREIRLPLREPFRISSGEVAERRILLLETETDDGLAAWSECVAGEHPNYSPETIDTAWHAIREWLAPRLLHEPLPDASRTHELLDADVRGHRMAKAALEMAVWALEAQRAGLPLARSIGGVRDRVDVGISIGMQPTPAALVDRAVGAARAGYRKIKLKIAPGADTAFIAAVRSALGPTMPLAVDANCAYHGDDVADIAGLDAFDLLMIEQPFAGEDLLRHAALQRRMRTPVCLDESITSVDRARDMIELRAGRIVNIKPGRVGGFAQARAIHDLCATHDVPVWCGGMLESGIGRAYNVALASLPNFSLPGDLSPSERYWTRDIVNPEWTMDADGTVGVPLDQPGIGVAVDTDRIDDLTVRHEVLGPD